MTFEKLTVTWQGRKWSYILSPANADRAERAWKKAGGEVVREPYEAKAEPKAGGGR